MSEAFSKYINFARFQISRLGGYSFDTDSLDFHTSIENNYFLDRISGVNRYLEFGAGASTLIAASKNINTVTIESDPLFMRAVFDSLKAKKIDKYVTPIIRPVGLVGPWGAPFVSLFSPISKKRSQLFREYSEPPLLNGLRSTDKDQFKKIIGGAEYLADLILIDGKFRVACALKLLKYFRCHRHIDYEIMVDDYVGREQYHILEKFFEVGVKMDELVTFHHKTKIDDDELSQTIKRFELIPD